MKTRPADADNQTPDVGDAPWKVGFSECRGTQNRCDILLLGIVVVRCCIITHDFYVTR